MHSLYTLSCHNEASNLKARVCGACAGFCNAIVFTVALALLCMLYKLFCSSYSVWLYSIVWLSIFVKYITKSIADNDSDNDSLLFFVFGKQLVLLHCRLPSKLSINLSFQNQVFAKYAFFCALFIVLYLVTTWICIAAYHVVMNKMR